MTEPAFKVHKKQLLFASLAGCFGVGLIAVLIWSLSGEGGFNSTPEASLKETKLMTAGQRVNPLETWVERTESELKELREMIESLIKTINKKDTDKGGSCTQPQSEMNEEAEDTNEDSETITSNSLPSLSEPMPYQHVKGGLQPSNLNSGGLNSGVRKIILKLSSSILPGESHSGKKGTEKSTLEDTLPAGAFAKAILLGGVDASTSVSSSSDPRPVLLRVTDHGTLPRKFKSDLKACHVLASSYGDLSSERVYMRLEKLTCTERLTGEISETQVSGYVVGEDGRTGVRGVVTDKAGPLIRNSLVGGFFSGMGQFFGAQQQKSIFPISTLGQTPVISPQQMLMSGASEGVSNAFEKYAEFFIKRAEQLQPVLQVAAGREVDIVFTQGTKFGETTARKSLSKIRDRSRKEAIQDLEEQPDSQNWIPQNPQNGDE